MEKEYSNSFAKNTNKNSASASQLLGKTPPHNIEAEQAVLGGILTNLNVFSSLVDTLIADDFYSPAHVQIFSAFINLYNASTPIDLITTTDMLQRAGVLETIGGASYIASLTDAIISSQNIFHYAKIIHNKAVQRKLIETATDIIGNCYELQTDVETLIDESEQAVFQISDSRTTSSYMSSSALVTKVFEELTERVGRGSKITGIRTGYYQFDDMTAGLQPSDLIIVAGRPSMGKTAFALNLAMRAACDDGKSTAIFSLEMSKEQLMMRMLGCCGRVDLSHLRTGSLDDADWKNLYKAAEIIKQAPIFIDDTPSISPLELRARCRRLKAEHDLQFVMVDYLQLMRGSFKTNSREQEISEISRSLKALAKELKIPVIALSQLNRQLETRDNKRPLMSDLRESGAIEQDADVIIFLYREDVYINKNRKEHEPMLPLTNRAEIIIGKQRNGPTGTVELRYEGKYTVFDNLTVQVEPVS